MVAYRGRFAPSPTGDLHLGSAATALVTWLAARAAGGRLILRVEDIDTARIVPGSAERQMEDLRWLGLDWDEGPDVGGPCAPYRQSDRLEAYAAAVARLAERGLVYRCDCSRAEVARASSAPHEGEEGPRYPGECRRFGLDERSWKRPPALRLAAPDREVAVEDRFQGRYAQNVWRSVGDFVLRRGDGAYSYQLAVVVDDLAMGVTEVVRGADLLSSAPRQALLAELLGGRAPRFAHAPLVLAADGTRLAKRAPGVRLRDHRAAGRSPWALVGDLARVLGLVAADARGRSAEIRPHELADAAVLARLRGRREVRLGPSLEARSTSID